jgi:hypothetical protein
MSEEIPFLQWPEGWEEEAMQRAFIRACDEAGLVVKETDDGIVLRRAATPDEEETLVARAVESRGR